MRLNFLLNYANLDSIRKTVTDANKYYSCQYLHSLVLSFDHKKKIKTLFYAAIKVPPFSDYPLILYKNMRIWKYSPATKYYIKEMLDFSGVFLRNLCTNKGLRFCICIKIKENEIHYQYIYTHTEWPFEKNVFFFL